jgi:hypothetical protein
LRVAGAAALVAPPPATVIVSAATSQFLEVNDTFLRMINRTRAEVVGHSVADGAFAEALARMEIVSGDRVIINRSLCFFFLMRATATAPRAEA